MSAKPETYLVTISIIEGRHFAWPNMDSAVLVQVHNQKKCTAVRHRTDCPFFNEYYVFEFHMPLEQLMDKTLSITVIQPKTVCRKKKILGYMNMDIATIWTQPDHQFFHKWAIISAPPTDPIGGAKGYVKVDINILGKGESPKIPGVDPQETDEIEGNLLLPEGLSTERQRAHFIVRLYRGENVIKSKFLPNKQLDIDKNMPNVQLEINFAGLTAKSSVKKNACNPVWNEQLVLAELFPPLCQRFRIQLLHIVSPLCPTKYVHHINLRSISNDGEKGFLPTFGPAFIHFYAKEATSEGYIGKVLLSIDTELQQNTIGASAKKVLFDSTPALTERLFWEIQPVLVFGAIFNVNVINKKFNSKSITFAINFGNSEHLKTTEGAGDSLPHTYTFAETPATDDKLYWYLGLEKGRPCVYTISKWPDLRKRMYNSNMIAKVAETMKTKLDVVENLFINEQFRTSSDETGSLLVDALDYLSSACRKYIDIAGSGNNNTGTELDKKRLCFCLKEMEDIEKISKKLYNSKTKKKCFRKAQKLLHRLEFLTEDAQDCWPDVYLWMLHGDKKVAYYKVPAREIAYSVVEEEHGKYCGAIQIIYFKIYNQKSTSNTPIACKAEVLLWAGLQRHQKACLESIPPGFKAADDGQTAIPTLLNVSEKYQFQCRIHIYQGLFLPGSDDTGLSDPFVRIIIDKHCRETAVMKAVLNPVWDQMLIIKGITVCGTRSWIKDHPPVATVEAFDRDECMKSEFIGMATIVPRIKLAEEPYSSPNFPPKLKWTRIHRNDESVGEILAAIELLEISGTVEEEPIESTKNEIIRIPEDIKPILIKYRVDVLFWGVRDLKRVHMLSINKPKITVEFGEVTVNSDTIFNAKKKSNFSEPYKFVDVDLPDKENYAPPITIKMYDCRSFGRYTFAGIHLAPVERFLFSPMTEAERNKQLSGTEMKVHSVPVLKSALRAIYKNKKSSPISNDDDPRHDYCCMLHKCKINWNKINYCKNICSRKKGKSTTNEKKSSPISSDDDRRHDYCCMLHKFKINWNKINCCKNICSRKKKKSTTNEKKSSPISSDDDRRHDYCCILHKFKINCNKLHCCKNICSRKKGKSTTNEKKSSPISSDDDRRHDYCCMLHKLKIIWNKIHCCKNICSRKKGKSANEKKSSTEEHDWWSKYHASCEENLTSNSEESIENFGSNNLKIKIYLNELENQPEFDEFTDTLQSFEIYKGKRTGDETVDEQNITGILKASIKIYRWPFNDNLEYVTTSGSPIQNGAFQDFPTNGLVQFVVRVYCVKGIDLLPVDPTGKADPYICITMNDQVINDQKNYVSKQISPTFGRCFELSGFFPRDHTITISVWDYDLTTSDDLIGETSIDIENRFYTRHRAHCGIASEYQEREPCPWRDQQTPTQILESLCNLYNLPEPKYTEKSVIIGNNEFINLNHKASSDPTANKEAIALSNLHLWKEFPVIGCQLVPEHVETRSLYHPAKPGIEQGKLQMWVDIFPIGDLPPPKQVDISPRKPIDYELRVIIWNTEDVILQEDDYFLGEKKSDLYVKGWITGPDAAQYTDIHYRSLTGEGNFNWRFIFNFKYLSTENRIVRKEKETFFSIDETEYKIPCKLTLQVWDNDTISADDFLGTVTIELSRLPRGARSSKTCSLKNVAPQAPVTNLFKIKRTRGWWPMHGIDEETKQIILAGKVEAEFQLLTTEEAQANPAGLGRDQPQALPPPKRPDTSFSWWRNPFKALKFVVCKHYRCAILKCCFFIAVVFIVLAGIYAFPGYSVKKLLGA